MPHARRLVAAFLVVLAASSATQARTARPVPCEPGRFVVSGAPIAGKAAGMTLGSTVSLDGLCADTRAISKINRKGVTSVLVRWRSCQGLTGTVVLKGKILAGCDAFTGTLKARKLKVRVRATRSRCGDHIVDQLGGEACDDGNTTNGDGCENTCQPTVANLPTTTTATTTSIPTSTALPTTSTTSTIAVPTTTIAPTTSTTHASSTTVSTTTSTSSSTSTTTLPKTVLGVSLVVNPDPIAPGGLVVYQLTATNAGPADAVQAVARMTLPAGTFACGTPSDGGQIPTGCAAAKDVVWALGTIVPGASRTVQLVVQLRGDVVSGTTVNATARLDDAAQSPQASTQATTVAETTPPLSLALGENADPVQPGDELEYVVRFGNRGANALLSTQLALALPAGTTVVDAGGGSEAVGSITWSLGAVTAGQIGERRVRVHIDDLGVDDPRVRVAHATITSGTESARATVLAQVHASSLALVLVAHTDPIAPADLIDYELTLTNYGNTPSDQPEVRLTLPASTFACRTPSDGGTAPEACSAGRELVWSLDPLAAGASRVLYAAVQIRGDTIPATALATTARAADASGARARASISTPVQAGAPLGLVLSTNADPVADDDELEYVLRFANRGANALLATQLTLVLPDGVTLVDAGGGTAAAGTITWGVGALNAAQADERRVRVLIDNLGVAESFVRRARAVITSGALATEAYTVTPVAAPILTVSLAALPDPLAPAGLLTYQLTVANRGVDDAQQVTLFLTLPSGVFACGTPSDGGTTPDGCIVGADAEWDLGAFASGATRTVQLVIQIRGDVPVASVLRTLARVEDAAGRHARAAIATTVQSAPPLNLVLAAGTDPAPVGSEIEYALRFGNRTANALLNTQLTFVVPDGTTLVDAGGGTPAGRTVGWSIGSLDGAGTGERRVRVHVDDLDAAEPLVRHARATVTSGAAAARASVDTSIAAAVLGLELTASPDPIAPGGLVGYVVTVSNRGNADAVQTDLRLTLPVGIFACATPSDGGTTPQGCSAGADTLWHLNTIAPGTSRVVQLAIQIRNDVPNGTILWTNARVEEASGLRTRTAVATSVQAVAPLDLAITTSADPIPAGEDLAYALRFGNTGAGSLLATQLAFVVPAGTTIVDAGGGTVAGDTVSWALGTLASQALGERVVTVHVVDQGDAETLTRVARATIASGTATSRAAAATPVESTTFGLDVGATPDPLAPAGLLTYGLTVTNGSAQDAVQVELRMTLPVGVFACQTLSDAATTPQGCSAGRDVVWNLGTMSPGANRTVQAVIQIRADVPRGSVLVTATRVQDASGERARAAITTGVGS